MKKYIRKSDAISGKLEEEQVILDIEKGKYFSLNPVATLIWEILEQPLSIDDLCEKLLEQYDVELEKCRVETNEYIQEMIKLGLVREIE
jgi:hypothetical protein